MSSNITLDAGGRIDATAVDAVRLHGAVLIKNTGLRSVESLHEALPMLGFGPDRQFREGGRTSASVYEKWVAPGLRRMDHYPAHLTLLPNNEVQYRKVSPRWVLFFAQTPLELFLHDAREVEARLPNALVTRLDQHGLSIETGFLSEAHPAKAKNYFQSWQERFGTVDPLEALTRAQSETDEYDAAWFLDDQTLMTRVTLPARWSADGPLRFPRIAMDGPAAHNGYRRFPLGNGELLSAEENDAIRSAYLQTRQRVSMAPGDVVLFDNTRFGHSRAPYTGERGMLVAMAGRAPSAGSESETNRPFSFISRGPDRFITRHAPAPIAARTHDARGQLDAEAITHELERFGAVHVQNTGLTVRTAGELPLAVLKALGFGGPDTFPWGGMQSGRTQRVRLSRELRATDAYPKHLWLLPHNEVLYQRTVPGRMLFFSATACDGRTFVHSAKAFRSWLEARSEGRALLGELREHGLRVEMGFVDEHHPERGRNFFRSWQERFETTERSVAEERCRASTHQFDDCWWHDSTLMTRIRVPAFHGDLLLFPRIALTAPAHENGYRRYPLGNGRELRDDEVNLLLNAFHDTREGVHWQAGDLLLVDNLRYGHSREAFEGTRDIGVAMAGEVKLQ